MNWISLKIGEFYQPVVDELLKRWNAGGHDCRDTSSSLNLMKECLALNVNLLKKCDNLQEKRFNFNAAWNHLAAVESGGVEKIQPPEIEGKQDNLGKKKKRRRHKNQKRKGKSSK